MNTEFVKLISSANSLADTMLSKNDYNNIYSTNEDFTRMNPDKKRLLIIGCSGSGKSTLLNRLAGFELSWDENGSKLVWNKPPLFDSKHSTASVTKTTSYANIKTHESNHLNDLIVIDTVGHDDPENAVIDSKKSRDKISEQACDLYQKLKSIDYLNTIVVLHNDISSNRLNSATYSLLTKINQMFSNSKQNIWDNIVVVYSKCDADSLGWKDDLERKKLDLQNEIKSKFENCNTLVPILTLSGLELPSENIEPSLDLQNLYDFVYFSNKLSTKNIVKFDGLHNRLEKIIKEKNYYCRVSNARQDFITQTFYFLIFIVILCFRNIFLPFLDFSSSLDELLYFILFVYVIGPVKFMDWLSVCWDDHFIPFLKRKEIIPEHTNLYLLGKLKEE